MTGSFEKAQVIFLANISEDAKVTYMLLAIGKYDSHATWGKEVGFVDPSRTCSYQA